MITDLNVILKEWAYRVQDGKPNPNNHAHLYHLSEILIEYKWPLSVIDEFLQNLNELEFTNQAAFDAYNKKHKMRKTYFWQYIYIYIDIDNYIYIYRI